MLKLVNVHIRCLLQKNAIGQDLFNHVVKHIGLRETWYFGLMIIKGIPFFIRFNRNTFT